MQAALAYGHFLAGRYDEATRLGQAAERMQPNYVVGLHALAIGLAMSGRTEEAKRVIERAQQLKPVRISEFRWLAKAEHAALLQNALRLAGMPE